MILQALVSYYRRLSDDPAADVAPFGFSRQKIAFCVTLNDDGTLHAIDDCRRQEGKTLQPLPLVVPGGAKPSGAGFNPGFLWDNTTYLLGFKLDDEKPDRTRQAFEHLRQRHADLEHAIDDPEFSAVCRFLKSWNPADAAQHALLQEPLTGFGVFRIRGQQHFVHERDRVRQWWLDQLGTTDSKEAAVTGQCLVTGECGPLARLHQPMIKGVMDAQSSGAVIVSFNADAYESFGRLKSFNAPVGVNAAFEYCTALNHLLSSKQRLQIGDATTVFWTEQPTPAEAWFGLIFGAKTAEDDALKQQLVVLLKQIADGKRPSELGDSATRFYVLGLSANASRLSVRFWHVSTLGDVTDKLSQHFRDLRLLRTSDRDSEFPALWQLLSETARESKDIPPLLSGALMRAVLQGTPYPDLLLSSVLRRIKADREIRHLRIAIVKAVLNRKSRFGISRLEKEIDMSLDPDRPEPAYQMGRLFAALEKAQEDALPGLNDTIKDRYFGAASATPASVFPRLIRLSQHHLGKLEKPSRIYHERRIQEIVGRVDGFKSHLNLQEQGLFAIGYYHQRQDFFTKKKPAEVAVEPDAIQ